MPGFMDLIASKLGNPVGSLPQQAAPQEPEITFEERQQTAREEILAEARGGNTQGMNRLLKVYGPEGPSPLFDVDEFGQLQEEVWGLVHKNQLKEEGKLLTDKLRQQEAAQALAAKQQAMQQMAQAQAATQQGYPPQAPGYSQILEKLPPGGTESLYEV